jgi:NAD(P)-dependent dehydrogenase (short-subunit alcohol dehydrogenase family)
MRGAVVVVAGAGEVLESAIATSFARAGARIAFMKLDPSATTTSGSDASMPTAEGGIDAVGFVQRVLRRWGRIDVFCTITESTPSHSITDWLRDASKCIAPLSAMVRGAKVIAIIDRSGAATGGASVQVMNTARSGPPELDCVVVANWGALAEPAPLRRFGEKVVSLACAGR